MEFAFQLSLESAVFWAVTVSWAGEFAIFRTRSYGEVRRGRRSYVLILTAIIASFALTGLLYLFDIGNLDGSWRRTARRVALVVYGSGMGLRYWAAWALGVWFSRRVEARPDQRLVSRGPYRCLRHPLYLGLFLLGTGLNGLMANPLGATVAAAGLGAVLDLRMVEEERTLAATIGSRYESWKSKRYRFVPFVY